MSRSLSDTVMDANARGMLNYVHWLIDHGIPFVTREASKYLGCCDTTVLGSLYRLQRMGLVKVETRERRVGAHMIFRSVRVVSTGEQTPWHKPALSLAERHPHGEMEEILRRRIMVEESRRRHREDWLARERAPRQRPAARTDFMDKATMMALQGLSQ